MTNNEIVEYVYKTIDIKQIVKNCKITSSINDMVQILYLILLEYDNEKLNNLYNKNLLKAFIIRTILNIRNDDYSDFNKYLKFYDNNEVTEDIQYNEYLSDMTTEQYEELIKICEEEFSCDTFLTVLYKYYILSDETLHSLSFKLGTNYMTLYKKFEKVKTKIRKNSIKKLFNNK